MSLVGAFARVELDAQESVERRLGALNGVTTFDLDAPGKVGLLIEASELAQAHECLTRAVTAVEGVLGVWPVYAHDEPEDAAYTGVVSRRVPGKELP